MYDFYYNVLIPYFGRENINLLMTDTDSLVVEIFTEDVYEDINKIP